MAAVPMNSEASPVSLPQSSANNHLAFTSGFSVACIAVFQECYHCDVFNLTKPKTPGQWIGHIVVTIIALFLVWWMLRVYVL
jgi:hypothetical protein